MFKAIALKQEVQSLTEELSDYKNRNIELAGEKEKQKLDYNSKINELKKKNIETEAQKFELERNIEGLKKENEILRKYYDLDKEPSDEIKIKIHIDLEVNRLKEENLKLIAMGKLTVTNQAYPIYTPQYGRMFY